MSNIAVIGAGISGLSAAYYLSKRGFKVDLFEEQNSIGGLAGTFDRHGIKIDRFYHHFYIHDVHLISLLRDLGLENDITWELTPTGMYYSNSTHRLSSPLDLIRFKPLSITDRLRMGFLILKTQRKNDYRQLENVTARDWLIKEAGEDVYRIMWEPLLKNKFGDYSHKISAAWICSKFKKRGASRSQGGREKLGYIRGGLGIFLDKLFESLVFSGVSIKTSSKVNRLIMENDKAKGIVLENGRTYEGYDSILSTLSPALTSGLICEDFAGYGDSLKRIEYLANITLVLFLKKSISNFYWLNVNDPSCPFVGVIEHTKLMPRKEYGGLNIVYIPRYLPRQDKSYFEGKSEVLSKYLPWIQRIFPDFDENDIADTHLCRDEYTQPVIETGYRELIPDVVTPIKNFYTVNMAQIYPEDRQISNAVRDSKRFSQNLSLQS